MAQAQDSNQHLFIVRIWTDPEHTPPALARGLIEHVPSGERQYFKDLGDIQGFVSRQLASPHQDGGIHHG